MQLNWKSESIQVNLSEEFFGIGLLEKSSVLSQKVFKYLDCLGLFEINSDDP